MFIRLKTKTHNDFNVNINHIAAFNPSPSGEGSTIMFASDDATPVEVLDSTRSIRGYVKKALFAVHTGGATENSDEV